MWTRKELKQKARTAFKRNYWKCVLAAVLISIIAGVAFQGTTSSAAGSGSMGGFMQELNRLSAETGTSVELIVGILAAIVGVAALVSVLVSLFIRNPLLVGTVRFFLKNTEEPAKLGELGYSFKEGRYLKTVGAMLLKDIFIFLWTLLLVIPGIIRSYDYYLVEYILADDPDMSARDALRKSKMMMKGHKWNTFVLNLSFLGWMILSSFTFGILYLFWVHPYMEATDAELYQAIKNQQA